MRRDLHPSIERGRVSFGENATEPNSGPVGMFVLPGPEARTLGVIADNGRSWMDAALPGEPWEHVSVSVAKHPSRTPTWRELEYVKRAFWEDDECAMQLHLPLADHVSPGFGQVLHLWRPTGEVIPVPPKSCV